MKKCISLWVVLTLLISCFLTGCAGGDSKKEDSPSSVESGKNDSTSETSDGTSTEELEYVKLHGYLLGAPNADFEKIQDKLNEKLKADLNCEMEITFLDWSVYQSKYPMVLAAGEDIDWIYTADWCNYASEAAKNAFLEIDTDMVSKYMPLYSSYLDPVAWDQVALNGKVYMLPTATPDVKGGAWMIRKDLADKYGVDTSSITKISEMGDYFKAIKENEPGMIPLNMDNTYDLQAPFFSLLSEYDATTYNGYGYVLAYDGDELKDGIYSYFDEAVLDKMKKAAYIMKDWYDNGYINRDVLSATTRSLDNFTQGISGVALDNTLGMQSTLAKCDENGWDGQIVLTNNAKGHQLLNPYTNNGFAIAASSQNVERTMMAMDLMMNDPEYNTLLQYGIEGEHYVLNSEGKVDFPEGVTSETTTYSWEGTGFWFINKNIQPARATWTDEYIKLNNDLIDGVLISHPNVAFTFTTDSVKTEIANINNVLMQYFYPIAIGNVDDVDAAFDELKTQLELAGLDTVVQEAKNQYEAYDKTK